MEREKYRAGKGTPTFIRNRVPTKVDLTKDHEKNIPSFAYYFFLRKSCIAKDNVKYMLEFRWRDESIGIGVL